LLYEVNQLSEFPALAKIAKFLTSVPVQPCPIKVIHWQQVTTADPQQQNGKVERLKTYQ